MGEIRFSLEQGVARVVIDDEAHHNAMSLAMWQRLREVFVQIDTDPAARVVVLRGAGDKSFVSGANIREFDALRSSEAAVAHYNQCVAGAQDAIYRCRVPVIAALSGLCFGGGLGLALCADLRYAATGTRFRMPAARLGLGYEFEGMKAIVRNLGFAGAAEAFFTARIYDADAACRLGVVQSVVDDVFGHADAVAQEVAANAPLTIRAAKLAMRGIADGLAQASPEITDAIAQCFKSSDYAEGRKAFAEKRAPVFMGQ
jgi:enoyl-CoA hydratase